MLKWFKLEQAQIDECATITKDLRKLNKVSKAEDLLKTHCFVVYVFKE